MKLLPRQSSEPLDNLAGTAEQFPVVYSLLAPEALTSILLANYSLGRINRCQFWHRGLSDVYLIDIEETAYILRISHAHWRSRSEIAFELEFLAFLHQNGMPVAAPLQTKRNNLFLEINAPEGKRYAALFPYAPGTVALGDLDMGQSLKLGETLAQIHQVSLSFSSKNERLPLTLDYLLDDSLAEIAPFLNHWQPELTELLAIAAEIKIQLKDFSLESPYWTVCWGDPHSGNIHFTEDNRMTLFDFDQCGYGWRTFDIAKFMQVGLQTGLSHRVRAAFIQGYQNITPLEPWEFEALKPLTEAAHVWAWAISLNTAQHYDYSRLDHAYFRQRLEQLKRLTIEDIVRR